MSAPVSEFLARKVAGLLLGGLLLSAIASAADPVTPGDGFVLQVLAPQLAIHAAAADSAPVIASSHRGEMLRADQREGDWFRIDVTGTPGWVHLEPVDHDMSLEVIAAYTSTGPEGNDTTPDIEQGPDGNLYVVSVTDNVIYRITRTPAVEQ